MGPTTQSAYAVLPIFEAGDDSQPKGGVLGKDLVETPQAHALLPILVVPHDTDGTNIVPA